MAGLRLAGKARPLLWSGPLQHSLQLLSWPAVASCLPLARLWSIFYAAAGEDFLKCHSDPLLPRPLFKIYWRLHITVSQPKLLLWSWPQLPFQILLFQSLPPILCSNNCVPDIKLLPPQQPPQGWSIALHPDLCPWGCSTSYRTRLPMARHGRSVSLGSSSLPSKISVENATISGKENPSNVIAIEAKHCLTEQLTKLSVEPWGMKDNGQSPFNEGKGGTRKA